MHLIVTLIVGGIVGWLASILMKTDSQMGIIANIAVGVVGSALGGWLAVVIGLGAYGLLARLIVGVVGAMLLLWILKALHVLR